MNDESSDSREITDTEGNDDTSDQVSQPCSSTDENAASNWTHEWEKDILTKIKKKFPL
jgi:hypothetical protein